MEHEPRGFLGNANSARQLIGTNAILAVSNHPNGHKPLIKRKRAILENGADLAGELLLGVFLFAFPHTAGGDVAYIHTAAGGAVNPVHPAKLNYRLMRHFRISEVADGFNKGLGLCAHRHFIA
jgi:hypothetical protein